MTTAHEVIERAKAELARTEDAVRNHPYVAAVEAGRVDLASLQRFCGNQYQMWKPNADAQAVSMFRFSGHPYRAVFLTPPEVEAGAAKAFADLGIRLGMDSEALDRFEPDAEAFGYAAYKAWLVCYGSAAEIACARALNLAAWGHACARLSTGLRDHFGLSSEDTAFLDGFSSLPSLEESAATVIDVDLQRGVEAHLIVRAARMMQAYEKMFWDAMARLSGL